MEVVVFIEEVWIVKHENCQVETRLLIVGGIEITHYIQLNIIRITIDMLVQWYIYSNCKALFVYVLDFLKERCWKSPFQTHVCEGAGYRLVIYAYIEVHPN